MFDGRNTSTKTWVRVFMKYLGQVYIDMPTGTPEKEYIRVAAKRFKEALGKIFRFESCVPILVQLARFSLNRFKRNRSLFLAFGTATDTGIPGSSSEDEEEEHQEGAFNFGDEEDEDDNKEDKNKNNLVEDGEGSSVPTAPGRFLTGPTYYAPPPGKTTGTKRAKAMIAAAKVSRKKNGHTPPPLPSQSVFSSRACCQVSC
jgi:hypothetical protein